jgi:putative flippase GtrA
MTKELSRFCRFGTVGVANTLLTLVTFTLLTRVGVESSLASALAFGAGAINGYLLNRAWTFHASGSLPRYVAVQLVGAACSAGGIALASSTLDLRHLIAECVVIPAVTLLTYTLSRRLVFGLNTT